MINWTARKSLDFWLKISSANFYMAIFKEFDFCFTEILTHKRSEILANMDTCRLLIHLAAVQKLSILYNSILVMYINISKFLINKAKILKTLVAHRRYKTSTQRK